MLAVGPVYGSELERLGEIVGGHRKIIHFKVSEPSVFPGIGIIGTESEITAEMLAAGRRAYVCWHDDDESGVGALVKAIYIAMGRSKPEPRRKPR